VALTRNGPHTVKIFIEEETTDHRGNIVKQPSATGVIVTGCWMQPLASTRGAFAALKVDAGQNVSVAFKLILSPSQAPLGWWSRVEWHDPITETLRKFAVLGGPMPRRFSRATDHLSCTLQEMR
jgi:hypothetical protein